MQISSQIDQLIHNLNSIKPFLSASKSANAEKFSNVLAESLTRFSNEMISLEEENPLSGHNKASAVPHWVNSHYSYDPENPRKPNMREFIEAISGKSVEELQKEGPKITQKLASQASEILFGVIGSNKDIRNWSSIMNSEDILHAARIETANMYKPKVDIETRVDYNGEMIDQVAVLKDMNEKTLRMLPHDVDSAERTLKNFGATHLSVPEDLENRIISPKFDKKLLSFLQTFDKSDENDENYQKVVIQTATENISRKLSEEIPLEELAKL
jgi:hypothetical protein